MSPDLQELSVRLLALETVLGHLVSHMAVHNDDPSSWLATRKVLALRAAHVMEHDSGKDGLAQGMSEAIAAFFNDVEQAVCHLPETARTRQ